MIRFCIKCPDHKVFGCTRDGLNYYCDNCDLRCEPDDIVGSICTSCISKMETGNERIDCMPEVFSGEKSNKTSLPT